jgi:hypothetical protein
MKKNGITFVELRELLLELGFREKSPTRFEHPATKTILLFRGHGPKGMVNDREMLVVRRQLVDNGLIAASAFDRFLQKVSA